MEEFVYYPLNDYGPIMKGMVVAAVAIVHVFLAQFAIGGGLLLCYFEWLAQSGREPLARRFVDGYFQVLVLASFILGALTGVGIWFTVIQLSPPTIGMMVREFHWVWAVEWTFFSLEVVAGYAFYRYRARLPDSARMQLLVLYTFAAWMSLFWINGILSWQLTPGRWLETRALWDGFLNPGFLPSLFYRTIVCCTLAALAACVLINTMENITREERGRLIHRAAYLLAPMALMPVFGAWYLLTMPADSQAWASGGSMTMTMFLTIAAGSSVLIGGYALVGLIWQKLVINGATATLLLALAFGATAGGEFVREGVRKPFTVRGVLYSNSVQPSQVAQFRKEGCLAHDPYPLKNAASYPTKQLATGAQVFRFQCSICHTVDGANALVHLAGSWNLEQMRLNIAQLQYTKPFMPPFAGSAEEVEALVQWIAWNSAERPKAWRAPAGPELQKTLGRIQGYLDEAGTAPGDFELYKTRAHRDAAAASGLKLPAAVAVRP